MIEFSKKYFEILNTDLKGLNLTAINDFEDFHIKQIVDSLLPLEHSNTFKNSINKNKIIVDVGFGGGFPLVPLAWKFPDFKFIGFEARAKKATAVKLICDKLCIKNVKTYHQRLENVYFDKDVTIVNKAVSTVEKFVGMINTNCDLDIFFYKAKNFKDIEGDYIDQLKNYKVIEDVEMSLSGGNKRILFGLKNENVPRRTTKNLVKFSSFL